MGDTDDSGATAGDNTSTPQFTAADLEPGTLGWRVNVAMGAHAFFKVPHGPAVAAAIGKTADPTAFDVWSVADYSKYLTTLGVRDVGTIPAHFLVYHLNPLCLNYNRHAPTRSTDPISARHICTGVREWLWHSKCHSAQLAGGEVRVDAPS
jgi:hypothetical protein